MWIPNHCIVLIETPDRPNPLIHLQTRQPGLVTEVIGSFVGGLSCSVESRAEEYFIEKSDKYAFLKDPTAMDDGMSKVKGCPILFWRRSHTKIVYVTKPVLDKPLKRYSYLKMELSFRDYFSIKRILAKHLVTSRSSQTKEIFPCRSLSQSAAIIRRWVT